MSTFELGTAPAFNAISYTWGEKDETEVWIGERIFPVRVNCEYALRQARAYRADVYVWIDSICINQEDALEKGFQVPMMGMIYAAASQVLACVGAHENGSELLMECVDVYVSLGAPGKKVAGSERERIMYSLLLGSNSLPTGMQDDPSRMSAFYTIGRGEIDQMAENVLYSWLHTTSYRNGTCSLGWGYDLSSSAGSAMGLCLEKVLGHDREAVLSLVHACERFNERSYWRRVWIIQEIAFAKTDVRVLCGLVNVSYNALIRCIPSLYITCSTLQPDSQPERVVMPITDLTTATSCIGDRIGAVLQRTIRSQCSDSRDHVFGILSLARVEGHLPPTIPDYTISVQDLARKMTQHCNLAEMGALLAALGLCGPTGPDRSAPAAERQQHGYAPVYGTRTVESADALDTDEILQFYMHDCQVWTFEDSGSLDPLRIKLGNSVTGQNSLLSDCHNLRDPII